MSYDLDGRIKTCDHHQQMERQSLSLDDFRSLYNTAQPNLGLRATVTSTSTVELFLNGVKIPQDHPIFGWDLVHSLSPALEPRQQIVFRQQMRMANGVFEVNYYTQKSMCLKCNGYGKVADYSINTVGVLLHVTDYNKLTQRILKFLLTSTCPFYPQFTSRLKTFIGMKFGLTLTEEDITYECMNTLENMRNIQIAQANIQTLTPAEILKSVDSVISKRDPVDPTTVKTVIQASSYGPGQVGSISLAIRTTQ